MIIAISLNVLYQYVMQILNMIFDTVHYSSVTNEPPAPVTPPTHSNHLPHTSYQDHTYSHIMSSHPYATFTNTSFKCLTE